MGKFLKAIWDRITREPVLLWGLLYAIWLWRYPDASELAGGVATAAGVLFQRSFSTPKVAVDEKIEEAKKVQQAEITNYLASPPEDDPDAAAKVDDAVKATKATKKTK